MQKKTRLPQSSIKNNRWKIIKTATRTKQQTSERATRFHSFTEFYRILRNVSLSRDSDAFWRICSLEIVELATPKSKSKCFGWGYKIAPSFGRNRLVMRAGCNMQYAIWSTAPTYRWIRRLFGLAVVVSSNSVLGFIKFFFRSDNDGEENAVCGWFWKLIPSDGI